MGLGEPWASRNSLGCSRWSRFIPYQIYTWQQTAVFRLIWNLYLRSYVCRLRYWSVVFPEMSLSSFGTEVMMAALWVRNCSLLPVVRRDCGAESFLPPNGRIYQWKILGLVFSFLEGYYQLNFCNRYRSIQIIYIS